jgi:hypothetical protein
MGPRTSSAVGGRRMKAALGLVAVSGLLLSAATVLAEPDAADPAGAEDAAAPAAFEVAGRIRLGEAPPDLPDLVHTKDQSACGDGQPDETWKVGEDGALANVVVELVGVAGGSPPAHDRLVLDQERCAFIPRVAAFPVGTEMVLTNSDLVFHNTRANIGRALVFNVALPMKGMEIQRRVTRPGLIRFSCDAGHPWMVAWAYVTDHPWVTVTDDAGRFAFSGVPPGEYTLKAWHEAGGERTRTVVVGEAAPAVQIEF